MQRGVLLTVMIFAAACGEAGPSTERFEGVWRLTAVNSQALPAAGNAGVVWVAAILQVTGETGFFDSCTQAPSTSTPMSHSTAVLVDPVSDDQVTLSYFDRRDGATDTATLEGAGLTLRHRITLMGPEDFDVLTFVRLAGELPEVCSLALSLG